MKIFYTASYYGKDKYQKYYDLVLKALEATKVEVISPEKNNYKKVLSIRERLKLGTKPNLEHYGAIKKGISMAEAVVIEVSNQDFQLGHEATLAIQAKKHVLCLSLHEDLSEKINSRYFHGAKYSELTIDGTIKEFITRVKQAGLGERFNCFLSSAQLDYLKKKAKADGITTSEYLRQLIDRDRDL